MSTPESILKMHEMLRDLTATKESSRDERFVCGMIAALFLALLQVRSASEEADMKQFRILITEIADIFPLLDKSIFFGDAARSGFQRGIVLAHNIFTS